MVSHLFQFWVLFLVLLKSSAWFWGCFFDRHPNRIENVDQQMKGEICCVQAKRLHKKKRQGDKNIHTRKTEKPVCKSLSCPTDSRQLINHPALYVRKGASWNFIFCSTSIRRTQRVMSFTQSLFCLASLFFSFPLAQSSN